MFGIPGPGHHFLSKYQDRFYNLTKLDKDVLSKQTDDVWTMKSSRNLLSLMLSHEHALDRIHEEFKDHGVEETLDASMRR